MNNLHKLKFYRVTDEYIDFLREIDSTILVNNYESRKRPYIGIILTLGLHQYFAPLSSYKPKYDRVKNHTIHKIAGNDGRNLAVIKLNSMFPILQPEIEEIIFKREEKKYKDLLEEEYRAVLRDQDILKEKARKLYNDVVVKKSAFFVKLSSNFLLLEKEYVKFNKNNH